MKKFTSYKLSISRNDLVLMLAAFVSYTGMYAVRKSFLAAQFADAQIFGYDYKTVLILSQVIGYMLSKFLGIKIVSESKGENNPRLLMGLVSAGLFFLFLLIVLPAYLHPVLMFFNGLTLGMIFGLVLAYLEGRRHTELLVAALSTTFIFSTGMIKTTGVWLIQSLGVNEIYMPFVTGLLFFPLFLLAVQLLKKAKKPNDLDILQRTERKQMDKFQRANFLKKHGFLFFGLVLVYILITASRDFRDNFTVEFWSELGYLDQPTLITYTEIPISILVLVISALTIIIINNRNAFLLSMGLVFVGAVFLWCSTYLLQYEMISPVTWMIVSGLGIYLPYILFHCAVFERLLAMLKYKGTIGFLFYVADALGYLVSVFVLLGKELLEYQGSWLHFFLQMNTYVSIGMITLVLFIFWTSIHNITKTRVLQSQIYK